MYLRNIYYFCWRAGWRRHPTVISALPAPASANVSTAKAPLATSRSRTSVRVLISRSLAVFLFLLGTHFSFAQGGSRAAAGRVTAKYTQLPLSFEPCSEANCGPGQEGRFLARGSKGAVLVAPGEVAISLPSYQEPLVSPVKFADPLLSFADLQSKITPPHSQGAYTSFLRMKLVGANPKAKVIALEELPGKSNYFIGNDPRKWRTDVPTFAKVRYEGVYPGIDLVYYGNGRHFEYDFIVAPGADPSVISLRVEGAEKPELGFAGDLVLRSAKGDVCLQKPVVYQESGIRGKQKIFEGEQDAKDQGRRTKDVFNQQSSINNRQLLGARFALHAGNRISFALGAYDQTHPLVIDPVLIYSTYLGGIGDDNANGIAVDSSGNAYITGYTASTDFPIQNPLQGKKEGSYDAFVTKFSASGDEVVYSTYLGGIGSDRGWGIAVDSTGEAYVTGDTNSADFPTLNPLQATNAGNGDAFVTKLNAAGNVLIYSTFLGGSFLIAFN